MPLNQEHINGNTWQYAERNDHMRAPLSTIPSVEHLLLPPGDLEKHWALSYRLMEGTGGDLYIK